MKHKQIFIFDLDNTLAPSKSAMDGEMVVLIKILLAKGKIVAVITGGQFSQIKKQFLVPLDEMVLERRPDSSRAVVEGLTVNFLKNIYLLPTCGAAFYAFKNNGWQAVYENQFSKQEKEKVFNAFEAAFADVKHVHPPQIYGELIEDRGTQITFSGLGQSAPKELKDEWDPERLKREKLMKALYGYIGEFDVRIGGSTSIDVTKKGIDKAYGIKKIEEMLNIKKSAMLFFGDAFYPGGNDYPVKAMGIDCIEVKSPEDTKKFLADLTKY